MKMHNRFPNNNKKKHKHHSCILMTLEMQKESKLQNLMCPLTTLEKV